MARRAKPLSQFQICTQECGARCCRYLTVEVAHPRRRIDWDEFRWWLAHEGVMISRDEEGWLLHVQTPCKNLGADNACAVYPHHMQTCKDYDASSCEYTAPLDYDELFREELDLAHYIERRKLKRAAPVAHDIRVASKLAAAGPRPQRVQLQGLPTSES
jgi:hypothetical protein